jgi:hypothetical protein
MLEILMLQALVLVEPEELVDLRTVVVVDTLVYISKIDLKVMTLLA